MAENLIFIDYLYLFLELRGSVFLAFSYQKQIGFLDPLVYYM